MPGRRLAFGPFVLNPEDGTLLRKGTPVPVSYRGLLLLTAFLNRPGDVLTKSNLIDAGWQGTESVKSSKVRIRDIKGLTLTARRR